VTGEKIQNPNFIETANFNRKKRIAVWMVGRSLVRFTGGGVG
jgi:hypothetical protein